MKILVLGLGNDLLGDDAIGILAARALQERLNTLADVVESPLSGVALLDLFVGYDRAIVIDALQTGRTSPGTISELTSADLDAVIAPSPHYTGLPEIFALADQLDLDFPNDVRIFAMEVVDPHTVGADLSEPVKKALPELVQRVEAHVRRWCAEVTSP